MYNTGDGFRNSAAYETYDGVVIGDDFWLATSAGLARVTQRMYVNKKAALRRGRSGFRSLHGLNRIESAMWWLGKGVRHQ